jgi:phospholipid/cholesterol/gamma-HCH transport system permease protein
VGLWKSVVFGALIAAIATFRGYEARGGAQGVGRATSRTVVETAVLILSGDYVMTALLF